MKISIDQNQLKEQGLSAKRTVYAGEEVFLVSGSPSTVWTKDNLIFRSSIWSLDGELLSAGFKKFMNLHEKPDVSPAPKDLTNTDIVEKIDGSLGIYDYFNGRVICRTRGTVDATKFENGYEFYDILDLYPELERALSENPGVSFLFEVVTPNQKIVIDYPKLDAYFVGGVYKSNYSLMTQQELDAVAFKYGFKRPRYYNFSSVDQLVSEIGEAKDIEGCCLYSSGGQVIHKIKGKLYLERHRMKSDLDSFDKLVDLWFSTGRINRKSFEEFILTTFDFEILEDVKENLDKLFDLDRSVAYLYGQMQEFVDSIKGLTKKEAALKILSCKEFPSSCLFSLFNKGNIEDRQLKKLYLKNLES